MFTQESADLLFVGRIGIGMEQTDRHCYHFFLHQLCGNRLYFCFDHRAQRCPVGGHAFGHFKTQPPFDQRGRFVKKEVIKLGRPNAAQFQHIAKAAGGDERGASAPLFQHGVGGDGGAMCDRSDRRTADPRRAQHLINPL